VFLFSQQLLSKTVLNLRILIDINVHRPSCNVLIMLVIFLIKLEFFFDTFFSKIPEISNSMVICPVETEFHADGQT
jgi:hypothetical protein